MQKTRLKTHVLFFSNHLIKKLLHNFNWISNNHVLFSAMIKADNELTDETERLQDELDKTNKNVASLISLLRFY